MGQRTRLRARVCLHARVQENDEVLADVAEHALLRKRRRGEGTDAGERGFPPHRDLRERAGEVPRVDVAVRLHQVRVARTAGVLLQNFLQPRVRRVPG